MLRNWPAHSKTCWKMKQWIALRCAVSNGPDNGDSSHSARRRCVLRASNAASSCGSVRPRRFLRTVVPGYRYGSELSVVQFIDGVSYLGQRQFPINVPLVYRLAPLIEFESFQTLGSQGLLVDAGSSGLLCGRNWLRRNCHLVLFDRCIRLARSQTYSSYSA